MKILIDLTSLADNFSGIERFALSIAQELIKDFNNQYILIFKNEIHKAFCTDYENVEKVIIKGRKKLFFNQVILPLRLLFIKADVYLFLAFPAPFFFFRRNVINAIHDLGCWDCPECNKKHMVWYFRLMYWKAALNGKRIITVSNFSKERIREILKVKPANITVIYNGISDLFKRYVKKSDNEIYVKNKYTLPDKYLLCLSTLEPRKNLRLLIDAYLELIETGEFNYELVLAGRKGWLIDELVAGIKENSAKHIHFTGFIDDEDLPVVYSLAEWFVFPSLYEGFGIPPVEAMSVGTRVISSDASSLPEVLRESAVYFHNNDKDDLKEKLVYAIGQSGSEKDEQIRSGIANSQLYDWSRSAKDVLEVINQYAPLK